MTPQGLKRSSPPRPVFLGTLGATPYDTPRPKKVNPAPPRPRPSVFTVFSGFSVSLKLKSWCTFLNTLKHCCLHFLVVSHIFFSIDYNISMPSTFISVSTGIVQLSTLCIPSIYNDCVLRGVKDMFIMHRRIWYSTKQHRVCVTHSCFNGLTVHRTYVLYTKESGMGQFTSSIHIALFSMHCRRTCCTQQCWL